MTVCYIHTRYVYLRFYCLGECGTLKCCVNQWLAVSHLHYFSDALFVFFLSIVHMCNDKASWTGFLWIKAGQILPSGKHQQSEDISEKPPGLRRCAEDPSGLTRAGTIRVNGLTLSCTPTATSNLWTRSAVLQDTFNGSASSKPFFTSVASITVLVRDIDNRPPWFQPCLRATLGAAKLCVSTGYRGRVNLTEKEVGHSSIAVGLRSL